MFVILQKYDFSSKSQQRPYHHEYILDVCDTAKVRFFKQITTQYPNMCIYLRCLWYCKSTIFQANHNRQDYNPAKAIDVCDTAKVRFFKQITTDKTTTQPRQLMFVILQKYDFSSKSQPTRQHWTLCHRCLWYCKSTIFQANHNLYFHFVSSFWDVCDTAKVRFFKQITTSSFILDYCP